MIRRRPAAETESRALLLACWLRDLTHQVNALTPYQASLLPARSAYLLDLPEALRGLAIALERVRARKTRARRTA